MAHFAVSDMDKTWVVSGLDEDEVRENLAYTEDVTIRPATVLEAVVARRERSKARAGHTT